MPNYYAVIGGFPTGLRGSIDQIYNPVPYKTNHKDGTPDGS